MKSIRATLLAIALAPLLSEGAFLDDLEAKSNRTDGSPFATGGDIILKISSREYVHIFTNVNTVSTFQLTERSIARILCVGGGGPGGKYAPGSQMLSGGGGGAGGFVEKNDVMLTAGTYAIEVGKGGVPSEANELNNSGRASAVKRGETDIVRAHGGGGGGSPSSYGNLGKYDNDARFGRNGASGGGACKWVNGDISGEGGMAEYGAEGHRGGLVDSKQWNDQDVYICAGGGGAGEEGHNNNSSSPAKGGDGKVCDITGEELWYAGGGAGGIRYSAVGDYMTVGGLGGGGSAAINRNNPEGQKAEGTAAVRGTGGGGYGGTKYNTQDAYVGNGADGIVIVRVVRAAEGFKVIVR